ncbi:hypothetical protein ACTMTI_18875 [Nonomuraea sp. H19]|uniref:hypothetical protein n=1 Tax=Nonomuraea sp. H19 TaxID=3452206 RepID=UPI003F8A1E54
MLIGPRDSSSGYYFYYDVDGFRVLRGCRATVQYNGGGDVKVYDRRGYSTSMWVRITLKSQANIISYTY